MTTRAENLIETALLENLRGEMDDDEDGILSFGWLKSDKAMAWHVYQDSYGYWWCWRHFAENLATKQKTFTDLLAQLAHPAFRKKHGLTPITLK